MKTEQAENQRLTDRMIMNKKYIFAMLWNWNQIFLGTKLNGVYLAVRILLRTNCVLGKPSSSRASSGNGWLKKMRRPGPPSEESGSASASISVGVDSRSVPVDSLFVESPSLFGWRLNIDWRASRPMVPEARFVAHRNRLAGAVSNGFDEASLSCWLGCVAMVQQLPCFDQIALRRDLLHR